MKRLHQNISLNSVQIILLKITTGNQRINILVIHLQLKSCPNDCVTPKWSFEIFLCICVLLYVYKLNISYLEP